MKKFKNDVLEVIKDIFYGVFIVIREIVIFFWALGLCVSESYNRIKKWIKRKLPQTTAPATIEVINSVVVDD